MAATPTNSRPADFPSPSDWTDAAKVDKYQNPWAVVLDYSKTVVTLASAILGFTVTFASNLVGSAPSRAVTFLICGAWFFLIVAIACALFVMGRITGYLRGIRKSPNPSPLLCNICYFALFLALLCFAVAGATGLYSTGSHSPPVTQESGHARGLGFN